LKGSLNYTKLSLVFALGAILLLSAVASGIDPVEALKSKGTKNTKYGSATKDIVCGDKLCSEVEEEKQKMKSKDSGRGGPVAQQSITVDTVAPLVIVPSDMTVSTTDSAGIIVEYTAKAIDDVDQVIPAVCTPASGSVFVVGDTTVTCSAVDTAGNTSTQSFLVSVTLEGVTAKKIAEPAVADTDGDGIADEIDNCMEIPNPEQLDSQHLS